MILTVDTVSTGADLLRPGWIDVSGGSSLPSVQGRRRYRRTIGSVR